MKVGQEPFYRDKRGRFDDNYCEQESTSVLTRLAFYRELNFEDV